jgi:RHS repeat-associated protein
MTALTSMIKTKWVAGYLHSLLDRMKPGRLRNILHWVACKATGHPVDVASGRVFTHHEDWALPGPLPVSFERVYFSSWANRSGPLGHGWSHAFDEAVWSERGKIVYLTGDGREIEFDTFAFPEHQLPAGVALYEPISRLTLTVDGRGGASVVDPQGLRREFALLPGDTGPRKGWLRLQRIVDPAGHRVQLEYDVRGNLEWLRDSGGRLVWFQHDSQGRLTSVKLPHPSQEGWLVHTQYAYDAEGDLSQVTDPLGHCWHFRYKNHLLVQETDRNGLSFYFAYDGHGEDACCVRTWGDGGIFDHVLDYDKKGKVTFVTNSRSETTAYHMNEIGLVTKIVDPLGAETLYEYHQPSLKLAKETGPAGGETIWTYDERGRLTSLTGPDGARMQIESGDRELPLVATDAMQGRWQWNYDRQGHMVDCIDPLGQRRRLLWQGDADARIPHPGTPASAGRPAQLAGIVDPNGLATQLTHDARGMLASMRTADGAETKWHYDNLGRCTKLIDPKGNAEVREFDPLGRIKAIRTRGGEATQVDYDPEGNVVRVRQGKREMTFAYAGLGRLSTSRDGGLAKHFAYDTEGRLTEISNEHGHSYRFELDPAGRVSAETNFDGNVRRYLRDKAGRVTKVLRANGESTDIAYDAAGRVVQIRHSSGESESYAYRADGLMVLAKNDTATVEFERDLLGRITREILGDEWVGYRHDPVGRRVAMQSSKHLRQSIERDARGRAVRVTAQTGAPAATVAGSSPASGEASITWEARIARDVLGFETERLLPGDVRFSWHSDSGGRPQRHEVWAGGKARRAVQYQWDPGDQLRTTIDSLLGPTGFQHDGIGRLASATYEDGRVQFRTPDAVGNVFRTADRTDRKYSPGGQLRQDQRPDGTLVSCDYDPEGNLVKRTEQRGTQLRVWTYEWNAAGMMTRVRLPEGDAVEFSYDAFARRLSKTYRQQTTRWLWDRNVMLHEWTEAKAGTAENTGDASPTTTWLFDPESYAPMAKLAAGNAYSILTDHLGTPTAMFDTAGSEIWSATVDIDGSYRSETGAAGSCPITWPGQYRDHETGLHYSRYRYYSPDFGGFISQDPLGYPTTDSTYDYVRDPLLVVDPTGLMPWAEPSRMGHHLVPRGKANSVGLSSLGTELDTPTFFPRPYAPGMHEGIHAAQRPTVGKLQGPWQGTADELLSASRAGLDDVSHLRGDLKIPRTGQVLASNVTPAEAFDELMKWHEAEQAKKASPCS